MYEHDDKINSFVNLTAWKVGHELVISIYNETDKFPTKEKYSLIDQIRRASVSITSNLAEGFGRSSTKDKLRFYDIARGSLIEVQNQLLIARDINYINSEQFNQLGMLSVRVHKLINALIKSLRTA
ncbi:MAG TPA: four helix bundle protein [Lentisphaeria bacterium]|nr:four helix bundle protein [Lentisphaeria bacterium]